MPPVESRTLANGLRVIVAETHSLPVVSVRLVSGVDSTPDPAGKAGLAALIAATMGEATQSKSPTQVQQIQAMLGTRVTAFRFSTTNGNFEPALTLMADLVANPAFPSAAIEQQKAVMLRRVSTPSPAQLPYHIFYRLTFGETVPIANVATKQSIAALSRDDVAELYRTFVSPGRTVLIVVGDVPAKRVFAAAESRLGTWRKPNQARHERGTTLPPARPTTIYLVDAPGRNQAVVYLGQPISSIDVQHGAALNVMTAVVGALGGSRLHNELRDRRGYMYSGSPYTVTWDVAPGVSLLWGVGVFTQTKIDSALSIWIDGLRTARRTEPTAAEMDFGRYSRIGQIIAKLESTDSLANEFADAVRHDRPVNWLDTYARDLQSVTPAQVQKAAADYIDPEHLTIVVAGDRKVVEPLLRAANFAPVVIVDESGHPVP